MNTREQGDIGVAQAIYWYTKQGYKISKPMSDSTRYDLVIEKNGKLYRVECKTSFYKTKYGTPCVQLKTCGGNQSWGGVSKRISKEDTDILFISIDGVDSYEIPMDQLEVFSSIKLGKKYEKYKLRN